MTQYITSKTISPNNTYLVRQAMTKYNTTTDKFAAWTGATLQVGFYEDALGATAIAGLGGLGMTESTATPGTYYCLVLGSQTATLSAYAGDTIYQIVTGGPSNDVKVVLPLVVNQPRYAQ
jgi:hypothetical protein